MANNDELDMLRAISAPPPGRDAKSRALQAALAAYDLEDFPPRPKDRGQVFVSPTGYNNSGVG